MRGWFPRGVLVITKTRSYWRDGQTASLDKGQIIMRKDLIVDDEPACRESMQFLLKLEGLAAESAASSSEALDLIEHFTPDVLVVDWMLKGEHDGLALARMIRQRIPNVRIILTSGHLHGPLDADLGEDVDIEYLSKPFAPDALVGAVSAQAGGEAAG